MEHIIDNKKLRWAVLQDIRARIHQGEAREAILADLGRKYYELDAVAALIGRVPAPEDVPRMAAKNAWLVALMWVWAIPTMVLRLLAVIAVSAKYPLTLPLLLLAFLWSGAALWLSKHIRQYDGLYYKYVGTEGTPFLGSAPT